MPRLTSQIFVGALIRQINQSGGSALVVRRGSPEAGAIYISLWSPKNRTHHLFEPAIGDQPTTSYLGGRAFRERQAQISEAELMEWMDREAKFDPDCWLVEVEHCPLPLGQFVSVIETL